LQLTTLKIELNEGEELIWLRPHQRDSQPEREKEYQLIADCKSSSVEVCN